MEILHKQCLESTAGYRLHWPPDELLQVGNFGVIEQNEWRQKGILMPVMSLRLYLPDPREPISSHTIRLSPSEQGWPAIIFSSLSHCCIDEFEALEKNLIERIDSNKWSADHLIIGEIIKAEKLQILVADQSDYFQWANQEPWLKDRLNWEHLDTNNTIHLLKAEVFSDALFPFYRCWQMIKNYEKTEKERNWDFNLENPDNWSMVVESYNSVNQEV